MRLLYYELYKIGTKKLLIGFMPILLIMNISLYTYTECQQNGSLIRNMHLYQLVESTYQSQPIQEGYETTSSKLFFTSLLIKQFIQKILGKIAAFTEKIYCLFNDTVLDCDWKHITYIKKHNIVSSHQE